jgi:hypothetical protein
VILVVAMEEGRSGIVRNKLDFGGRLARHADRILQQPRCGFVTHFNELERVPMHMHRMLIAAAVVHDQSVSLALLNGEEGVGLRP